MERLESIGGVKILLVVKCWRFMYHQEKRNAVHKANDKTASVFKGAVFLRIKLSSGRSDKIKA